MAIKVFHLTINNENFYFGSKKAIFDHFHKEDLGIGYAAFRNIKNLKEKPFQNKFCVIREGELVQAVTNRNRSKNNEE